MAITANRPHQRDSKLPFFDAQRAETAAIKQQAAIQRSLRSHYFSSYPVVVMERDIHIPYVFPIQWGAT